MAHSLSIIASREQSSMVSGWTEYLCLQRDEGEAFKLFTGQYEALAERNKYFNEATGEYEVPEVIDGKPVVGLEDDYVVGGELVYFDDQQAVSFQSPDDRAVVEWLQSSGWSQKVDTVTIRGALGKV